MDLPVVAGVEITTDGEGRFNLNTLHNASGEGKHKAPNRWLANKQTIELIDALKSQTQNLGSGDKSATYVNIVNGGNFPGTFAQELLAISYAGWISPSFQLQVNQVFLDFRSGKFTQQFSVPSTRAEALRLAADLEEKNTLLQEKIAEDRPKVIFADAIDSAPSSILMGELAKNLRKNGFDIGQNRLFEWMRDNGWLMKRGESYNLPTQKGMELELFEIKPRTITSADGTIRVTKTTKVTGKGQQYFINHFLAMKEKI
ncbi:MAG: phage antirepressor KilAC domain-containing protein [Desulfobulbaceae bacterium]|nr:phage antirepressor KilAC domain-containing protein [Desulfobulbaceae bacterium]